MRREEKDIPPPVLTVDFVLGANVDVLPKLPREDR